VRLRSCAGPTGHPACQLLPSCAAVTVLTVATHRSGTAAAWLVGDGAGGDGVLVACAIAVGGDAVGRPGGVAWVDGLGESLGVELAVGAGFTGGSDDAMAGAGDTGAAGLENADPLAGDNELAPLAAP